VHAAFLLRIRQIGRRTAELHNALASGAEGSAFTAEPIAAADIAAWSGELADATARMLDHLARAHADLPESVRSVVADLVARKVATLERVRGLLPTELDGSKSRYHGDLHLGQLLIVNDDVFIIDFEGEPARSLEERRVKAAPARDVAGLIRSIDYAGTAVLDRIIPSSPEDRARLVAAVEEWRTQCVQALWSAYQEHVAEGLWPADPDRRQRLIDFFVLQKAVYEIGYELANRPTWLHVPVQGLARILFTNERVPA
jgi:maltose alpha-D-glucosyltransferase/alpha-amylase